MTTPEFTLHFPNEDGEPSAAYVLLSDVQAAFAAIEPIAAQRQTLSMSMFANKADYDVAIAQPAAEEPYAYAVYFPDQPTEMLAHDLDELCEDMTNREHTITPLFDRPTPAPIAQPVVPAAQPSPTIPEFQAQAYRVGGVFCLSKKDAQDFIDFRPTRNYKIETFVDLAEVQAAWPQPVADERQAVAPKEAK